MRIGAVYPQTELGGDPDAARAIGTAVEALGFDHLVAYDHVLGASHDREPPLPPRYSDADPFHDPFVLFAHLAALTERIELVTGVLVLPQRQTGLVARQSTDVDLLSGGRLRLGVGTGWNWVEYEALGQDFAVRGRRLDEQIELLRRLWSDDLVDFDGAYDRVDRANILPRPCRSVPIWVGGMSAPAFRRGARLGDGFIHAGPLDACLAAKEAVAAELATAGRDPSGFGNELLTRGTATADDVVGAVERWREAGGTHVGVVSMGLGLDSTEAHHDFYAGVADRLGLDPGVTA